MSLDATTPDGRAVVLHEDGTWEFAKSLAQHATPAFRKATWGVDKDSVRQVEGIGTIQETPDVLLYAGAVAGMQCHIIYVFAVNCLIRGKYAITEQHSNNNRYLMDFETLNNALSAKYGETRQDNMHWLDNTFRGNYEDWGLALSMGHWSRFIQWQVQDTDITLFLTGDNYEVNLGVEYASRSLAYLEEQKTASRNFEDL